MLNWRPVREIEQRTKLIEIAQREAESATRIDPEMFQAA